MRVIAGSKKGLRLKASKDRRVRPTTDSAKEFVFNVIGISVRDSVVLDVFAGTGSLGIEALSRGAAKAVFVENSRQAQILIRENLNKCNFLDSAKLISMSAVQGLKHLGNSGVCFDLIIADPPYEGELAAQTLGWIEEHDLLVPGGLFVLEHGLRSHAVPVESKYMLASRRRKGDSLFSFYHNNA